MSIFDSRVFEMMQAYPFWLLDISPTLNPPFMVFNPFLGFSAVSGISLEAETETYRPLNSSYPISYVTGATVGAVSLSRGARMYDTDFYRWVERAINGIDKSRRNLILIHFTTKGIGTVGDQDPLSFRVPGRAWILWDVIPTQYTAGDLDATSGEVVIQELTVQPSSFTEIALGAII